MINLAALETLGGVAGTAAAITYTLSGMQLVAGVEAYLTLAQGQLPAAAGTLYTSPALTQTFIKTIHLANTTGAPVTAAFYINGTAAANQIIALSVPANGSAIFNQEGWRVFDSAGSLIFSTPLTLTGVVIGSGSGTVVTSFAVDMATQAELDAHITDAVDAHDASAVSYTGGPGISATDVEGAIDELATEKADVASAVMDGDAASGDLTGTYPGPTITADAVSNAKLANMTQSTFKGRAVGAGTGDPTDLTATQATAILDEATMALKGLMSAVDKLKLNNVWFDVTTDFGANNLDKTGATDNTTKINNILTAVPTNSVLFWPPGTYDTTGGHSITKCLIFMGAGRSISVINMTAATGNVFSLSGAAAGTGFEQLRISADTAALRTAGFAVDFDTIANSYMQQCDILFHHSGVRSNGALQFLDDMNIREMGANAANGQAVLVTGPGDRYLRRLTTDNPTDPTGFSAVRVTQCSSLVMSDCNLINGTNAFDIVPLAGLVVASVLCVNTFFDSSAIGVNIIPATPTATAHRIRFVNCWFSTHTVAGVRMGALGTHPTANINSVDFVGCDFYQNPVGIDAVNIAEWSVRASRIAGNTTAGIRCVQGDQAGVHGFSITDNFISNGAGFGANGIGITVAAGTYNRYQILDNRGLESNTTPGLTDSGSVGVTGQKNVKNNMGALLSGALQLNNSAAAAVIVGRGAVTSGTGNTYLFGARIPANAVSVGQIFKIRVLAQASSTGTTVWNVHAGAASTTADAIIHAGVVSAAAVANQYVQFDAIVTVVALGPTATVAGGGQSFSNAATTGKTAAAEVVANVPTTAPWFISVAAAHSVGTLTVRACTIEAI